MRLERQMMMEAFDKKPASLLLSQKLPTIVQPDLSLSVRFNTKGSCSVANETRGHIGSGCRCELHTYVDYISLHQLVA